MNMLKMLVRVPMFAILLMAAASVEAAQLSTDARTAIPRDVQQLIVIDYKAMQNSIAATNLHDRVTPAELKQFEEALRNSGLNDNHDVDQLAYVLFRPQDSRAKASTQDAGTRLKSVGIAQGQFPVQEMLTSFRKQKLKATILRTNKIYPLVKTGMVLCFVDASTMLFGDSDAVRAALDARDGIAPSLVTNAPMMDAMKSVEAEPLWSILDQKGTEFMMKQVLGQVSSITNFESVQKRLQASWYSMDFQHGAKFALTISTGDSFTAATIASLLSAAVTVRKMNSSDAEKQALSATTIGSDAGRLSLHFAASDAEFAALLHSSLFQGMLS